MAVNTGDPDADAVLTMTGPTESSAPSITGDPDADKVLRAKPSISPSSSWLSRAKGAGETALALGSASLKSINKAVNDLLPGEKGRHELQGEIETDPILNYHPGPEAAPYLEALSTIGAPLGKAAEFAHQTIANVAGERTADVAGDLTSLALSQGMLKGGMPRKISSQEQALNAGRELGYVVPPATTNPTVLNTVAEGFAGKLTTAQKASMMNQEITNGLVRKEFGLTEDAPLTSDTMQDIRAIQSPAYEAVKQIPQIPFGSAYGKALDALATTSQKISQALPNFKATGATQVQQLIDSLKPVNGVMDGETAVELSKSLRAEAKSYQTAAAHTGDPTSTMLARAYRGSAEAVENTIEDHLNSIGQSDLARNWDEARTTIAKTYSVENALDGAGNVDALKLGKQLLKGKPLSGNLEAAANFANAFPKAARNLKESSPGMSPLDVYAGAATEAATGHPEALAIGPARMAARAALLSHAGQWLARPGTLAGSERIAGHAKRLVPGMTSLPQVIPPIPAEDHDNQ